MFLHYFCCLIFFILVQTYTRGNLVSIKQGLLRGTIMLSRNGTLFNAYLGIPFAEPPIGNLRFKAPVPAKPWKGIFNATETPSMCIQVIENTTETQGTEDCLNLNVYSPLNAKPGDKIPVVVYIFGGIFKRGSNIANGPQYIMNKRVIIVMPNYRLGVLGFLSTGDTVISGNFGMKDQLLALKWTKENIYAFGGDSDLITLHGHSSGAMCVHLHMFSSLSKGLFNRVIIQSGSGIAQISFFDKHVSKNMAMDFARRVGCSSNSSEEMLNCFLTLKAETFPLIQDEIRIWNKEKDTAIFRPTVEDKNVQNAFITELPIKSRYQSTNLRMLTGLTTGEGAFMASEFLCNGGELANELDIHYRVLFPITIGYFWTAYLKAQDFISKIVRTHYFGNKRINNETAVQLMDMYTESLFVRNTLDYIHKYGGVKYVYLYDYWSNYSTQNKIGYYRRLGISHAEELHLIFYHNSSASLLTNRDIAFGDELITRLVNFIYSGNPNEPFLINKNMYSAWSPVESDRIEYLRIKLKGTMETNYWKEQYKFWKHLPIWNKFY